MNEAHWHLIVNHLPIIFPIVGVLVMSIGLIFKSDAVIRTAFLIFIIGSVTSFAAMATGEGAEEVVEKLNGVSENYIERHQEVAKIFAILSYILGGISLLGLWASFKQKTLSYLISIAALVFAFVVLFFAKQTGTTGGEIRHTEIRVDNNVLPAIQNENQTEEEDDD